MELSSSINFGSQVADQVAHFLVTLAMYRPLSSHRPHAYFEHDFPLWDGGTIGTIEILFSFYESYFGCLCLCTIPPLCRFPLMFFEEFLIHDLDGLQFLASIYYGCLYHSALIFC